jgi:serine/threonine protein kinase
MRHKNVVDAGNLEPAEDGTLFFSMEYVDGPDLRDFLDQSAKPFDVKLALDIVRGVAEGLGAAHAQGMVHRDIKPENILMARSGEGWVPKIADFGIVATKETSSMHTRTGGTLLTMAYAAPEQWRGMKAADLDGRTDLYALGGVLYEMLAGRTAFEADNYEGWAERHKNEAPLPPGQLRPELANWRGLDALVLQLLAKDREKRPKDVAEVLGLLDAVTYLAPKPRQVTEAEPRPPITLRASASGDVHSGKKSRGRVPVWVGAACLLVLLAATFSIVKIYGPRPGAPQDASAERSPAALQPPQARPETHAETLPAKRKPADTPVPVTPGSSKPVVVPTSPKPGSPEENKPADAKPAVGTLRVLCDLACSWMLDGVAKGSIGAGGSSDMTVEIGQHVVVATSADGTDDVVKQVDIKSGGQVEASMELKPFREARIAAEKQMREQAARVEEARVTWTDPVTGLMWAKKDNGGDVNWQQATDYCRNLRLAGHSNWRLATMDELQGIYDPKASVPGLYGRDTVAYHVRGGLQLSSWYEWSSSPGNASSGEGWVLRFSHGNRDPAHLVYSGGMRALCVRSPGE